MRFRQRILCGLFLPLLFPAGAAMGSEPVENRPIVLRTPRNGDHFAVGDTLRIGWRVDLEQVTGLVFSVSLDSGKDWFALNGNAVIPRADTGTFAWEIPPEIGGAAAPTTQGKVRINDYNRPLDATMEGTFTVSEPNGICPRGLPAATHALFADRRRYDLCGRAMERDSLGRMLVPVLTVKAAGASPPRVSSPSTWGDVAVR